MGLVIDNRYKEIVTKINATNFSAFDKSVMVLEEMDNLKDEENDNVFSDYSTIAKAVIEAYLGYEIEVA